MEFMCLSGLKAELGSREISTILVLQAYSAIATCGNALTYAPYSLPRTSVRMTMGEWVEGPDFYFQPSVCLSPPPSVQMDTDGPRFPAFSVVSHTSSMYLCTQ